MKKTFTKSALFSAILALLLGVVSLNAWAQTVNLVGWSVTSGTAAASFTATTAIPANAAVALTTSMGTNITFTTGTPGSCYIAGWDSGNGVKNWNTTAISTVGYTNLTIQNASYGSGTGPRDFKVQYKVGAGTWTDVSGATYTLTTTSAVKGPFTLPAACENQTQIYLRWIMTSDLQITSGNVAAGGTSRMAEVYLKGTAAAPTACATPTFTPPAGNYTTAQGVGIFCATVGATIHYTIDGSTPTVNSPVYLGVAAIDVITTTTIKAIAIEAGLSDSEVATALYTVTAPKVETPTFNPIAGTYSTAQNVAIACTTPGATIHYTLDGSTPTANSAVYVPMVALINIAATTTIKAIAILNGMDDSEIATAIYNIVAPKVETPTFNPNGGTFTEQQYIFISCSTNLATIHYTIDGSTPTANSPVFSPVASLVISTTTTIKAIAIKAGLSDSEVATVTYNIVPFFEDFETGTKVGYADGVATCTTGEWQLNNVLYTSTDANDKKNGTKSLRFQQSVATCYAMMNFNKANGCGELKFYEGVYGTDASSNFVVEVSNNNGNTWGYNSGNIAASATWTQRTLTVNMTGNVKIRITKANAAGRINIDDITMTNYAPLTTIVINEQPQTKTYTGQTLAFDVIVNVPITGLGGFTVKYYAAGGTSIGDGGLEANNGLNLKRPTQTLSEEEVDPIEVGSYDVVITRAADATYAAFSTRISNGLVIEPAPITNPFIVTPETAATYDADTKTLTILENASIKNVDPLTSVNAKIVCDGEEVETITLDGFNIDYEDDMAFVCFHSSLTINLVEGTENMIGAKGIGLGAAELTINGLGSLSVVCTGTEFNTGIWVMGDLTIDGGSLSVIAHAAETGSTGISVDGSLYINSGTGNVTAGDNAVVFGEGEVVFAQGMGIISGSLDGTFVEWGAVVPPVPAQSAAIGDVYYSDGTISMNDVGSINAAKLAGKTPIGIVFYTEPSDNTKGWMVALKDANGGDVCAWKNENTNAGLTKFASIRSTAGGEVIGDTAGYSNTKSIRTNTTYGGWSATVYPAFWHTYNYNDGINGAGTTDKWYLPAAGQLRIAYSNYNEISKTIINLNASNYGINAATLMNTAYWYWTSTEDSTTQSWFIGIQGTVFSIVKNRTNLVYARAISAF